VITRGSASHEGKALPEWSVLWIGPDDDAPELVAGPEGCDLVVTRFPRRAT
jgi:hypothetical protein